ncbi:hypothetical protein EWM63_29595 [Pseudoduganella lutea]|uniref:Uncharacterized protein n=2 Tax=Pseudoduganella lutea TaxID=321985 RepID=A0A4V0Z4N7_9BURK|nr:hypothetical protein EWM63_29595 [Pseudoduganella lutea]
MNWEPISEACLCDEIRSAEGRMSPRVLRLREAIKIPPEKWVEPTYGTVGGGFWVVAIIGNRVIWFNDIEVGFNCSLYVAAGQLAEYFCNQDQLEIAVQNVLAIIETGKDSIARCSAPVPREWQ